MTSPLWATPGKLSDHGSVAGLMTSVSLGLMSCHVLLLAGSGWRTPWRRTTPPAFSSSSSAQKRTWVWVLTLFKVDTACGCVMLGFFLEVLGSTPGTHTHAHSHSHTQFVFFFWLKPQECFVLPIKTPKAFLTEAGILAVFEMSLSSSTFAWFL